MWESKWQELLAKLEIRLQPGWVSVPKPTEDDLIQFETAHNFKLPQSYRSFIKLFGAGTLAFDFKLLAPIGPNFPRYDLGSFNLETKSGFTSTFLHFFSEPDRVKRLTYFAIPENADLIGWDPEDIRDRENHEYGICELGPTEDLELVAISFSDFIDHICLADPGDESVTRLVYEPAQVQ